MSEMTPADVMALNGNNRDGFLNGGGFWYIIVLFFIFAMFGGGFGGFGNASAQGALTRAEMADGFNTAAIQREQGNTMRDIFNLDRDVLENRNGTSVGFAHIGQQIMENRYAAMNNECETQKEIMRSRYDAAIAAQVAQAQQAQCCCDLKTAIHAEGEATRAMLQQQTIDDLKSQLNQAQTAVANAVQTNNILGSIGRFVMNPPVSPCNTGFYGFTGYNGYNQYNQCGQCGQAA